MLEGTELDQEGLKLQDNSIISLQSVNKTFGTKTVLEDLSIEIKEGKFYSLVGESGSGKTTTLRLMNGLERPTTGEVLYNGEALNYRNIIPVRRSMGYCLQGYTLFPHMNIEDNITIVARKAKWKKKQLKARLEEVMGLMNLDPGMYLSKTPNQLSGGQRQRVGIARAIFMNPSILLMDEPFGALDPITRNELQNAFIELQKKLELSVVLVTHDISEAFKMSHEVMLLNQGRLAQQGKPNNLLTKPASDYVFNFLKTNSPGHILKEVPVYSVLFSDLWIDRQEEAMWISEHIETKEERSFSTESELETFLREQGQKVRLLTDSNGKFLSARVFATGQVCEDTIEETRDLLTALQLLLKVDCGSLPVINQNQQIVGVFGQEAINVIG